ncbi:hypothetical protein BDZ45DRAFT_120925 [Acephala macrosclerotiorum]|nr:hypothetical protein BDZ45DRAFT_120925 [Acephala macrosclerotiorum]
MTDSIPARHLSQRRYSLNEKQIADGAIVPFSTLPTCAAQCGPLFDVQAECTPPTNINVDDFCFCADTRLTPFNSNGTSEVGQVCGSASCSAEPDLQAIKTWYQSFCTENGLIGAASVVTSTTGAMTMTVLEVPIAITAITSGETVVVLSTSFSTIAGKTTISLTTSVLPTVFGNPSTTPAEAGGLSPGAKIGIAVGVTVVFLLALLTFWWMLVRRKKRNRTLKNGKQDGILLPRPNTHEVMTLANTHEMSTKHNVLEMDGHTSKKFVRGGKANVDVLTHMLPLGYKRGQAAIGGLSASHDIDSSGLNAESQQGMENVSPDRPEILAPFSPRDDPTRNHNTLMPHEDVEIERGAHESDRGHEEEERKLKVLRDRIDRIREEKERLERIQELKDLEEQTKREILEAQRRQL